MSELRRQQSMPKRYRIAQLALAPVVVFSLIGGGAAVAAASTTQAPRIVSIAPRFVTTLQMFTRQSGVALAKLGPPDKQGRTVVVQTSDGGLRWTESGYLPAGLEPRDSVVPALAFADPRQGYVAITGSRYLGYTSNGGRTWSLERARGPLTAISISRRSVWLVSAKCRRTKPGHVYNVYQQCSSELEQFTLGARRTTSSDIIPTEGPVLAGTVHSPTFQANLVSRSGRQGLFVEGGEGAPSSILRTQSSGHSWTLIDNPCRYAINGIVQTTTSNWFLYCALDGGMNQGINQFWSTNDAGADWVLRSEGSEQNQPPNTGTIGAVMLGGLTASGNGRLLWMLGQVGGIVSSADGGVKWSGFALPTGGAIEQIAVAGGTEAWLPLPGQGLYRTLNGLTWTKLP